MLLQNVSAVFRYMCATHRVELLQLFCLLTPYKVHFFRTQLVLAHEGCDDQALRSTLSQWPPVKCTEGCIVASLNLLKSHRNQSLRPVPTNDHANLNCNDLTDFRDTSTKNARVNIQVGVVCYSKWCDSACSNVNCLQQLGRH